MVLIWSSCGLNLLAICSYSARNLLSICSQFARNLVCSQSACKCREAMVSRFARRQHSSSIIDESVFNACGLALCKLLAICLDSACGVKRHSACRFCSYSASTRRSRLMVPQHIPRHEGVGQRRIPGVEQALLQLTACWVGTSS